MYFKVFFSLFLSLTLIPATSDAKRKDICPKIVPGKGFPDQVWKLEGYGKVGKLKQKKILTFEKYKLIVSFPENWSDSSVEDAPHKTLFTLKKRDAVKIVPPTDFDIYWRTSVLVGLGDFEKMPGLKDGFEAGPIPEKLHDLDDEIRATKVIQSRRRALWKTFASVQSIEVERTDRFCQYGVYLVARDKKSKTGVSIFGFALFDTKKKNSAVEIGKLRDFFETLNSIEIELI